MPCLFIRNLNSFDKATIIYSHGNSSDIGTCLNFGFKLSELLNLNILLYDYRGYGISKGYYKLIKFQENQPNIIFIKI